MFVYLFVESKGVKQGSTVLVPLAINKGTHSVLLRHL